MTYEQFKRLETEWNELWDKTAKLEDFIEHNEIYPTLSKFERFMLTQQAAAMDLYLRCLEARISFYENKVERPQEVNEKEQELDEEQQKKVKETVKSIENILKEIFPELILTNIDKSNLYTSAAQAQSESEPKPYKSRGLKYWA